MSDQCPSTLKKNAKGNGAGSNDAVGAAAVARAAGGVVHGARGEGEVRSHRMHAGAGAGGGERVWKSLEEHSQTPEFREFVEREFPKGASELLTDSRRDFIKFMGAGLALAGLASVPGCRRPEHHIMAYSREVPEEVIPGKSLYYATSMTLPGGGAEGLLVETHEARPTKIEGNPLHPVNRGKSSPWAQASVLSLYDPDRLKFPHYVNPARASEGRLEATWDDFRAWAGEHFAAYSANRGQGLVFLADKKSSPSRDAMRDAVRAKWPAASWIEYDALGRDASVEATRLAFGRPGREVLRLASAKRIVSLDRDFLCGESGSMVYAREFAAGRRPRAPPDDMNRLYAIEPRFTMTGAAADHRWRVAPSRLTSVLVLLARAILARMDEGGTGTEARGLRAALEGLTVSGEPDVPVDALNEIAADLVAHRGEGLVVGGESLGAAALAVVHAINLALGNTGRTVGFLEMGDDEAASSMAGLAALAQMLQSRSVSTLVCLGTNPLFNAPADLGITADAFARVGATITLGVGRSETEEASTWSLNAAHELESWGDTEAIDGTIAPIQPMIAPLYEPSLSEIEFLSMLVGENRPGHEIVKQTWERRLGPGGDRRWRRALHDGMVSGSTARAMTPTAARSAVMASAAEAARAIALHAAPSSSSLDVVFFSEHLHDGRFANLPWLQELPQFGTRVVWDNPALVSPATARALGIMPEDYTRRQLPRAKMVEVTIDGRSMEIPVWILPGMADNTIALQTGFGRTACGVVGEGAGFNTFAVRSSGAAWVARGASLRKTGGTHEIVSTQNNWSIEGRDSLIRTMDLERWKRFGDKVEQREDHIYAHASQRLNMAEAMGELSHTPPNLSAYVNPYNNSIGEPSNADRVRDALGRMSPPVFAQGPQWGMTIDMSTCTGCGACTIACQSENNIPVVGKREVAKGREMTWIRVDRYYVGDSLDDPAAMTHQPIACVHCENAPCETVCPVNATVHGPQGTNDMVYNRCIGTRYCANNCPYKVRRFNFFDYAQAKFNGNWVGTEAFGNPRNINFIPPRLREQVDEITKMRNNPDVTVRGRGVMEKCTYCMQRINKARFESKLQGLEGIPEGFFQVACQQACPSEAIVFGDILNPESAVSKTRDNGRSFLLLGYLNTRPRTSHLARVNNPNPALVSAGRREEWEHDPFAHHGGHGHDDHGDGHGDGHGGGHDDGHGTDDGHGSGDGQLHTLRRIPSRASEDTGYLGSLSVLSDGVGDGIGSVSRAVGSTVQMGLTAMGGPLA
ncbi:MAG: TAT-variant-translocated molybdopterin oxidoreductase [Phycisphaerales bacterium]